MMTTREVAAHLVGSGDVVIGVDDDYVCVGVIPVVDHSEHVGWFDVDGTVALLLLPDLQDPHDRLVWVRKRTDIVTVRG